MSNAILAVLSNLVEAKGAYLPDEGIAAIDFTVSPIDAYAEILFGNNGNYSYTGGGFGQWKVTGAAADYDIRFTYTGDNIGLTSGTWYNLGTTRSASLSQAVVGSKNASGTIAIRRTASGAIQDTCTFSIAAEESL